MPLLRLHLPDVPHALRHSFYYMQKNVPISYVVAVDDPIMTSCVRHFKVD